MLPDTCYLIHVTWYLLSDTYYLILFSQSVSLTEYVVLSVCLSACLSACPSVPVSLGDALTTAAVRPFLILESPLSSIVSKLNLVIKGSDKKNVTPCSYILLVIMWDIASYLHYITCGRFSSTYFSLPQSAAHLYSLRLTGNHWIASCIMMMSFTILGT